MNATMPKDQQSSQHSHFAGRLPAGSELPIIVAKNGARHTRILASGEEREVLAVGLACSECFSGPRLAEILRPGFEYEKEVMKNLLSESRAGPLSTHTSSGVPVALSGFISALEPHLPWKNKERHDDWCVSLQLEGASAVWAAIDMVLQVNMLSSGDIHRKMVAVGANSYHGPPVTSFGSKSPMWRKNDQVIYPVPGPGFDMNVSGPSLLKEFERFLNKHGDEIGALLIEPQWGSSQAAYPWPKELLQQYVKMTKDHGIPVIADEIMCGLGRHGQGTLFLSEAWDLDPDAVTFGKSIGGGVYPLSGAILKTGAKILGANGRSVMQSHTFSGASSRSLMTGTAVLNEVPKWFGPISELGDEMGLIFDYLERISDGLIHAHGQGLLWGCLFTRNGINSDDKIRNKTINCFKRHCEDVGILPYYVPVGGFTISPVIDINMETAYEIGAKLEEALKRTIEEVGWQSEEVVDEVENKTFVSMDIEVDGCASNDIDLKQYHRVRSYTSILDL